MYCMYGIKFRVGNIVVYNYIRIFESPTVLVDDLADCHMAQVFDIDDVRNLIWMAKTHHPGPHWRHSP